MDNYGLRPDGESPWMSRVLWAAGTYDVLWAMHVLLWPNWLFQWSGMAVPSSPEIWQFLAILIGVGGLGYMLSASRPFRQWPIILIGFLGKLLGIGTFLKAVSAHRVTWKFGSTVLTNDVVWLVPFSLILWAAYSNSVRRSQESSPEVQALAFRSRTNRGTTLLELSRKNPILLVFLRYKGCPFCRETLSDLAAARREIESRGTEIVLVHMEKDQAMQEFLLRYSLQDLQRISDPKRTLYRAFGLRTGSLWNLIGPLVWRRGIAAAFVQGFGWSAANPFQMPGVFSIYRGNILKSFMHQFSSDRPNYKNFAPVMSKDSLAEAEAF